MRTHITALCFMGWAALGLSLCLSACGSQQVVNRDDDQVVGRPPAPSEDPFLNGELPPEAQRVSPQGSIEAPKQPTPEPAPVLMPADTQPVPQQTPQAPAGAPSDAIDGPDAFPEPPVEPPVQPESINRAVIEPAPKPEPSPAAVPPRVAPAPKEPVVALAPASPAAEQPEPDVPSSHRCYSCVRICAQSDRSRDCSDSTEDVVCGWGHSEERSDAKVLAQAQCDATLDLMRQTPQWSTIEGECPVASCR